jgi:hypothetical protein
LTEASAVPPFGVTTTVTLGMIALPMLLVITPATVPVGGGQVTGTLIVIV